MNRQSHQVSISGMITAMLTLLFACGQPALSAPSPEAFAAHWYQGQAEISSFELEQARYGEVHPGHAVLIYVTEDFSRRKQVKLDNAGAAGADAVKVLKLNATKKFNTGVYPYSMMSSVFTPVDYQRDPHTLKVSTSSQEWCGHTFTQLNRQAGGYRLLEHSYFESEGEQDLSLSSELTEDGLWTLLRLDPMALPTGEIRLIPGTMYARLRHLPWEARQANAELTSDPADPGLLVYRLEYPSLGRELSIHFQHAFPHRIEAWEESSRSRATILTTRATRKKTLVLDYWSRNGLEDVGLRRELGLE